MKLLVIEDDLAIVTALKEGLEDESYAVDVAYDGDEGLRTALADEYDVILLDIMLPGKDGLEVCRELRAEGNTTPILMLTAKTGNRDIVKGLMLVRMITFQSHLALRCYWRVFERS